MVGHLRRYHKHVIQLAVGGNVEEKGGGREG